MRTFRAFLMAAALTAAAAPAMLAQPKPSPDEFVPVEDAPPGEQIPAINLVAAAYGFVWIAVVAYVWSLGRRLQKAEAEIAALEQRRR